MTFLNMSIIMISMSFTSILMGFVVFLTCVWLVRRPNLPPGPWSWPIIGYRFGSGLIHNRFMELFREYGPIFSFRKGPYLVVVLNGSDAIRRILVKNANAFSDRFVPGHIHALIPASNKNASMVWSSGKQWSDLRRFGLTALRAFGMGKKSLEPQINQEARIMCAAFEKLRGSPVNPTHILNKATSNVICQLVFGRRFEYDDDEFQAVLDGFFENFTSIADSDPVVVFPFLVHLPGYSHYRSNFYRSEAFVRTQLNIHESSFQNDNIRDIIDAFLADDISKRFTLDEFGRVVLDFFAAGTETTSTVLSWVILYLAVNPDIQRKVHGEIDSIVGRGRQPTTSDRLSLPYCEATLTEIMRIRPVLPTSLPHKASQDFSMGQYSIPKGTVVIPNIWAAHHDPEEWKHPDVFDPQRFLEDDSTTVKKSNAWMPFGVGRRECLGAQLAKMETFLFFTSLFQRFDFSFPPDQSPPSMQGISGLTMTPHPYQVCVVER